MLQRFARHLVLVLLLGSGAVAVTAPSASAVADRDCADFASQRSAQIFFLRQGGPHSDPHRLDADGDGIACESNPAPYYHGTTLPGGPKADPKPTKVTSFADLGLSRGKAISGEKVKLVASVKPRATRKVVFQQRTNRRWKAIDRDLTSNRGRATHTVRAPSAHARYRVKVLKKKAGEKIYLADVSKDRRLRVQRQRARLTLSRTTAVEGRTVKGTVHVTPVRRGRGVDLEIFRNGAWRVLRSSKEGRDGVARFTLPDLDAGDYRLRAKVDRWRGAGALRSNVEQFEVRDVTAPAAPTNVFATPFDSAVHLSWSAVSDADLSHYSIYHRAADSETWVLAGTTQNTEMTVGSLTNGVSYVFVVVASDGAGNSSGQSAEASATPVAPPADQHSFDGTGD